MNLDESTLRTTGRSYLFTSYFGDCYNSVCNSCVRSEPRKSLDRPRCTERLLFVQAVIETDEDGYEFEPVVSELLR